MAVCEVEQEAIPQEYDYLLVDNIREATRKKGYTEETETYYTCDLIAKFYEYTAEQIEARKKVKYTAECIREIGKEISIYDELKLMRRLLASIDPAVFTDAKARMNFLDYNVRVENTILDVTKKHSK